MGRKVKKAYIQYVDASGPSKCRKCGIPVRMFNGEIKCPECFEFVTNGHLGAILTEVELFPTSEVEEMINERVGELKSSMALQALPDAEPSFLCKYCNYLDECQVDANEIITMEAVSNEI